MRIKNPQLDLSLLLLTNPILQMRVEQKLTQMQALKEIVVMVQMQEMATQVKEMVTLQEINQIHQLTKKMFKTQMMLNQIQLLIQTQLTQTQKMYHQLMEILAVMYEMGKMRINSIF